MPRPVPAKSLPRRKSGHAALRNAGALQDGMILTGNPLRRESEEGVLRGTSRTGDRKERPRIGRNGQNRVGGPINAKIQEKNQGGPMPAGMTAALRGLDQLRKVEDMVGAKEKNVHHVAGENVLLPGTDHQQSEEDSDGRRAMSALLVVAGSI